MVKTLLGGAILAVFGALTVALGGLLGYELDHVALLGVALGAVVGLVPDRSPLMRVLGFFAGVVIAWAVFALRAAVLPDTSTGRAVATFLAILLCVAVAAASLRRIPMWSALVGAAAVAGAYESVYTIAPSQFLRDSPVALTTVLLAAAMGHLATAVFGPEVPFDRDDPDPVRRQHVPQRRRTPAAAKESVK